MHANTWPWLVVQPNLSPNSYCVIKKKQQLGSLNPSDSAHINKKLASRAAITIRTHQTLSFGCAVFRISQVVCRDNFKMKNKIKCASEHMKTHENTHSYRYTRVSARYDRIYMRRQVQRLVGKAPNNRAQTHKWWTSEHTLDVARNHLSREMRIVEGRVSPMISLVSVYIFGVYISKYICAHHAEFTINILSC